MQEKDDFFQEEPRQEPHRHLQDELPQKIEQHLQNNFISHEEPELIHQSDSNEQNNQKPIIRAQSDEPQPDQKPIEITQQPQLFPSPKQQPIPIPEGATESQIQWIYKQASMQRIGGTFDFFAGQMDKYRSHIEARKNVLQSIYVSIEKSRSTKANTVMLLKQYFKQYSQICTNFHEKCYKYQIPSRQQNQSKLVNIRVELKTGLERLFNVRKNIGNQHCQLQKFIKNNTINKIERAVETYWGNVGDSQNRVKSKRQKFIEKSQKFQKRIDKIAKVYNKGRYGSQVEEDLFIQMTKFVKEQKEMRYAIFDWGKEVVSLRKIIIKGDYALMIEFQSILTAYKNFNDSIFQLKKKKYNYPDKLKEQIQQKYLYQNLCLPIDNDYIIGVLNFKKRKTLTMLTQTNYEQFLNEQYFGTIIGDTYELLKGTVVKYFPLKNPEEDLVRTISGNFVLYSRKTLEIINKLTLVNTVAEFEGNGCVRLREKVVGIIFDSEKTQRLIFANNDRAQELVMSFNSEFGKE